MGLEQGSDKISSVAYEKDLWVRFQQGDEKALSAIYSAYFDPLYNYGFKFTKDATLVEDCIQELFLKLMRNRENFSVPDSVKNYLFKAFRSYIFDKMEQLKKYASRDISETAAFELEAQHASHSSMTDWDEEKQKKLQSALELLTPRQREAIFLKYQEGFSYPEIARMLSLSQKATYKLVARAIQTLRNVTISILMITGAHFL